MKWRDARKSHLEHASSSVPKVKTQTDVNSSHSVKASPATGAKKPLSMEGKMKKDLRVIIDIIPCVVVTRLGIHGYRCFFRHADGERKPSALSSKEVAILKKKKKVQGCVSQNSDPMNSILRKAGQTRLNASAEHTRKFSGCTWYETEFGKETGNLEAFSKKVNLMSEILARPFLEERTREETSRQPDCSSKAAYKFGDTKIQAQNRR